MFSDQFFFKKQTFTHLNVKINCITHITAKNYVVSESKHFLFHKNHCLFYALLQDRQAQLFLNDITFLTLI